MFYYNCKSIFTLMAIGGVCVMLFGILSSGSSAADTNKVHALEEASGPTKPIEQPLPLQPKLTTDPLKDPPIEPLKEP